MRKNLFQCSLKMDVAVENGKEKIAYTNFL